MTLDSQADLKLAIHKLMRGKQWVPLTAFLPLGHQIKPELAIRKYTSRNRNSVKAKHVDEKVSRGKRSTIEKALYELVNAGEIFSRGAGEDKEYCHPEKAMRTSAFSMDIDFDCCRTSQPEIEAAINDALQNLLADKALPEHTEFRNTRVKRPRYIK